MYLSLDITLVNSPSGKVSPGEKAGIQTRNLIISINGETIESINDIGPHVQKSGKEGKPLKNWNSAKK